MSNTKNYSFFAMLFRQKYMLRWSMMRNNTPETLSQHSMECALLAHALATIGNTLYGKQYNADRAAVLGLLHDAAEVYTSDLPTPIKYFSPQLQHSYAQIEQAATDRLLEGLPPDLAPAYKELFNSTDSELNFLVHAADKLCAYIKCLNECNDHNSEFEAARQATLQKLQQYHCPEVDYFLQYLLPAFTLPLDKL